jgi:hypothetical protein
MRSISFWRLGDSTASRRFSSGMDSNRMAGGALVPRTRVGQPSRAGALTRLGRSRASHKLQAAHRRADERCRLEAQGIQDASQLAALLPPPWTSSTDGADVSLASRMRVRPNGRVSWTQWL